MGEHDFTEVRPKAEPIGSPGGVTSFLDLMNSIGRDIKPGDPRKMTGMRVIDIDLAEQLGLQPTRHLPEEST